jgi:hypothetical protein
LTCASGNGRNLSPITTFFSFMHYDLDFHGSDYNTYLF